MAADPTDPTDPTPKKRDPWRPKREGGAKQNVTLRLEPTTLAALRATGPGWHGRVDEALREWLARRGGRPNDTRE